MVAADFASVKRPHAAPGRPLAPRTDVCPLAADMRSRAVLEHCEEGETIRALDTPKPPDKRGPTEQPSEPPVEDPRIRKGPIEEPPARKEPPPTEEPRIEDPPAPGHTPDEVIRVG
jgi:hypothetical protein